MLTCGHFQEVIERLLLIAVLLELNLVNEQADGQPLKKTTTAATAGHILKARILPGSSRLRILYQLVEAVSGELADHSNTQYSVTSL